MEKSWEKYLAGTEAYRARVRQWEKDRKLQPDLEKPGVDAVLNELFAQLIDFGPGGDEDHLTVRLKLASEPDHSNGRWEPARNQVVWESSLASSNRLPVFCYASWSLPAESFQRAHFGRVILRGDDLLKYCLWREKLGAAPAGEWENWLPGLQPGAALTNELDRFQFSQAGQLVPDAADYGRNLLKTALGKHP